MEKKILKRTYITEKELIRIFEQQYNDIFSEILRLDKLTFYNLLKKQVTTYLDITKKHAPQILFKKAEDIFVKKFVEEKEIVSKDYEYIKNTPRDQLEYLDRLNCIVHCPKMKNPLHSCGARFILCGDYVFCLYCIKVFNEFQVHMYCDECDTEFYTKLREIIDYNFESYFLISISNYHCNIEEEEIIKCPECEKDLFVDISSQNNYKKIEEATCLNCNYVFNVNLLKYECKKCGEIFKSDAKIYNCFYKKRNDLICKIHALCNKKLAGPENVMNKTCDCNLNTCFKYKHSDQGILYEGERNGKKVIVCDKCLKIFDYYYFKFSCPLCNKKFTQPYNEDFFKSIKSEQEKGFFSSKEVNKFNCDKRNTSLLINKITKAQCSSTSKNKNNSSYKKDKILNNPFCSKAKNENNENNKKFFKIFKKSKTFREIENEKEKETSKNSFINQPLKNSGQKINIKIQNFYNNYVPIIHIVEKASKNTDVNKDSNYIINKNYTLIHNSPKTKKRINNMVNASKYVSNAAFLKRSITETTKYNLSLGSSSLNPKKILNYLNQDKEKDQNINLTNNIWINNKSKYSASFTMASSDSNTNNNYSDQTINQSTTNKSQNKEQKDSKRYLSENRIKHKMVKKKRRGSDKFNFSEITSVGGVAVNTIKEINEEYLNDKNDRKVLEIKKPKSILKINSKNDSNRKLKRVTISSSFSIDKDEKTKNNNNDKKIEVNNHEQKSKINKLRSKPNIANKENNNHIKSNNRNLISVRGSNIPKAKKPIKIKNDNKQLENKKIQIIKDFNSEDYNIIDMLGEGTFSQIFLVENGKTKKRYALKKMSATKMEDLEEKKKEFEIILKLKKEDEKLNIVKIFGIQIKKLDKFNIVLYILMEAAKSDWETELKNRHYAKNYYTEEELNYILISLVSTFSSLQKKHICHRDVKPQNILFFDNNTYKITDFGEAKADKNKTIEKNCNFNFSQDTSVQTVRGTELYMSPILFNALRNSPGDDLQYNAFKSDVFSLGLCFLLAGSLSYKPLSELRNLTEMEKIKMVIEKYLKNRYSNNFVNILISMLQLEEKDRPDFLELEKIIQQNLGNKV